MLAYSAGIASNTREQVEQRMGEALLFSCATCMSEMPGRFVSIYHNCYWV